MKVNPLIAIYSVPSANYAAAWEDKGMHLAAVDDS
jgi:hypothetical protein